jgi:hypothetical protein
MGHQLYMRLTCLEMEKHRRGIEREAALTRMRICDDRCRDIEREMVEIKEELHRRRMLGDPSVEAVTRAKVPRSSARGAAGDVPRAGGDSPVPFKY